MGVIKRKTNKPQKGAERGVEDLSERLLLKQLPSRSAREDGEDAAEEEEVSGVDWDEDEGTDGEAGEGAEQRQEDADDEEKESEEQEALGEEGRGELGPGSSGVARDGGVKKKEGKKNDKKKEKLRAMLETHKKRGVCYLSRIPPHMKPLKLRHLLSQYAEVLRVYLAPEGSLPHIGDALIVAKWPALGLPRDAAAVARFEELQSLVRSVRNARAEYTVEPGKRIGAIVVAGPASLAFIQEESAVLVALCKLDPLQLQIVDSSSTPGEAEQAVHLVVAEGLEAYLPLAGMVDIAKEVDRLSKQAAKLEAELAAAAKRLSMPSAAEAEEKLSVIKNRLVQLEAMATPAAK
eukprot:jgi/Mesen1/1019/ME000121S00095